MYPIDTKELVTAISKTIVNNVKQTWRTESTKEQNVAYLVSLFSRSTKTDGFAILQILNFYARSEETATIQSSLGVPSTVIRLLDLFHEFNIPQSLDKRSFGIIVLNLFELLNNLSKWKSAIDEIVSSGTFGVVFEVAISFFKKGLANRYGNVSLDTSCQNELCSTFPHIYSHLDKGIIHHLSSKGVVKNLVTKLHAGMMKDQYFPLQLAYLFTILIDLITSAFKNVNSQIPLNEFTEGEGGKVNGYQILLKFLFFCDQKLISNATTRESTIEALTLSLDKICNLTFVGDMPISVPIPNDTYNTQPPQLPLVTQESKENSNSYYSKNSSNSQSPQEENIVKNLKAVEVLQVFFLKCENSEEAQLKIIELFMYLSSANRFNFWLCYPLQSLILFIENLMKYDFIVQETIMRLLVFSATVLNFVPITELTFLFSLINENTKTQVLELIYQTLIKLLSFSPVYKKVFRESGLLSTILKYLKAILPSEGALRSNFNLKVWVTLMDTLILTVKDNKTNANFFRTMGGITLLTQFAEFEATRLHCLKIIQILIQQDETQQYADISGVIELLQTCQNKKYKAMKADILQMISRAISLNLVVADSFRELGGFVCLISVAVSLENSFSEEESEMEKDKNLVLIERVIQTLTLAMKNNVKNKIFFMKEIGYSSLASAILLTNFSKTHYAKRILNFLMNMMCENVEESNWSEDSKENWIIIQNAEASGLFVQVLVQTEDKVQKEYFETLFHLIRSSTKSKEALTSVGCAGFLMKHYRNKIRNIELCPVLQPLLLDIIICLGCHRLSPKEWRQFFRYFQNPKENYIVRPKELEAANTIQNRNNNKTGNNNNNSSNDVLDLSNNVTFNKRTAPECMFEALYKMAREGGTPTYLEFDMSEHGFAQVTVAALAEKRYWPTNYTISFWLWIGNFGSSSGSNSSTTTPTKGTTTAGGATGGNKPSIDPLPIYLLNNEDGTIRTRAYIFKKKLCLKVNKEKKLVFPFTFNAKTWYHATIVQTKFRFGGSEVRLFVNGFPTQKQGFKTPTLSANVESKISISLGRSEVIKRVSPQYWRVGSFYMIEEALTAGQVLTFYFLGPNFAGTLSSGGLSYYQTWEIVDAQNIAPASVEQEGTGAIGAAITGSTNDNPLGSMNLGSVVNLNVSEDKLLLMLSANHLIKNNETLEMKIQNAGGVITTNTKQNNTNNTNTSNNQFALLHGGCLPVVPCTIQSGLHLIGGVSVILSLLEASDSSDILFLNLSILVSLIQYNPMTTLEMEEKESLGYLFLSDLLKQKREMLNLKIMNKLLELCGMRLDHESLNCKFVIANLSAMQYIITDFALWCNDRIDLSLQQYLFDRILSFIVNNDLKDFNLLRFREISIMQKLLFLLQDYYIHDELVPLVVKMIKTLLEYDTKDGKYSIEVGEFLILSTIRDPLVYPNLLLLLLLNMFLTQTHL